MDTTEVLSTAITEAVAAQVRAASGEGNARIKTRELARVINNQAEGAPWFLAEAKYRPDAIRSALKEIARLSKEKHLKMLKDVTAKTKDADGELVTPSAVVKDEREQAAKRFIKSVDQNAKRLIGWCAVDYLQRASAGDNTIEALTPGEIQKAQEIVLAKLQRVSSPTGVLSDKPKRDPESINSDDKLSHAIANRDAFSVLKLMGKGAGIMPASMEAQEYEQIEGAARVLANYAHGVELVDLKAPRTSV